MNHNFKKLAATAIGLCSVAAIALRADPVTVAEVGVGANETVWIDSTGPNGSGTNLHVYAGVLDLQVNGVATTGFCIDPWHWSGSGALNFNTESLNLAPKATSGMGTTAATEIEQLWAQYYSPSISNINAAAMQIEIWTIVDAAVNPGLNYFKLDSVDSDPTNAVMTEVSAMAAFLADPKNANAPTAVLTAVTGPGQDYVIPNVPDGGATLCMLGLAFVGLVAFRKKFRSA